MSARDDRKLVVCFRFDRAGSRVTLVIRVVAAQLLAVSHFAESSLWASSDDKDASAKKSMSLRDP